MTGVVLDASALLALLQEEPGASRVEAVLGDATMSTANVAEVAAKYVDAGLDPKGLVARLTVLGVAVEPVVAEDVDRQARVRADEQAVRARRLSLADRLCLALAMRLDRPALTADRAWADLDVAAQVELIR